MEVRDSNTEANREPLVASGTLPTLPLSVSTDIFLGPEPYRVSGLDLHERRGPSGAVNFTPCPGLLAQSRI
jgi:hypothetical protein